MLVAIVTAPLRPASATIAASRSWCLALSTSCLTPRRLSMSERYSEFSIDTVPTSTGRPGLVHLLDLLRHGVELALDRAVDEVVLVFADHGAVRSG